jgi:His-Xaa-Ser system radical SAM maturase HxsC
MVDIYESIIGKVTFKPIHRFARGKFVFLTHDKKIDSGYAAILTSYDMKQYPKRVATLLCNPEDMQLLAEDDIISIEANGNITVLYKKNSIHNFLLVTEHCNCSCIMCPNLLIAKGKNKLTEVRKIISLIDKDAQVLGITGGEPTLIGDELINIIILCKKKLPNTKLLILSNGIKFADFDYVKKIASTYHPNLTVDIPIYSDTDTDHNNITGVDGFYRTIEGIYNLARLNQKIGIRIVIHKLNYMRLPQIAEFVYHNFPFVYQIAFMQMEITGMAKINLNKLWIDPYDYSQELEQAVTYLDRRAMNVTIYNTPLCILPKILWKYAKQSISPWKNIYLSECENCICKGNCAGFFSSSIYTHSNYIKPIAEDNSGCHLADKNSTDMVLNEEYYASSKCYRKFIENHWIYFSPNNAGLPIAVSDLVNRFFEAFQNGQKIKTVLDLYHHELLINNISIKDFLAIIDFFINAGFLKRKPEPEKYQASKLVNFENINSINIWLHLTNRCNLQCKYCFVTKSNEVMSEETIKRVATAIINTAKIRSLHKVIIKFAGGEPTLVLDKIKMFHKLIEIGLNGTTTKSEFGIISNGTLINNELMDFLQEKNCGISISLDGYGMKGNDIYRKFKDTKNGSWNVIERNIKLLTERGIYPYIMSTISEASCSTLTELMSWIITKGFATRLGLIDEVDRGRTDSGGVAIDCDGCVNAYINAFEMMFTELEKGKYVFDVCKVMQICDLHFNVPSYDSCCGMATNHIVISQEGKLTFCPMNIRDADIDLSNDLLVSIRETINFDTCERNDHIESQECLACQWFPVCIGGCIYSNIQKYKSPFAKPALHKFYKYVIPRYVEFYGKKLLQYAKQKNILNFQILGKNADVIVKLY